MYDVQHHKLVIRLYSNMLGRIEWWKADKWRKIRCHTTPRGFLDVTLWLFNIAMENDPFIDDVPIKSSIYSGFSMAMLNNQMVAPLDCCLLPFRGLIQLRRLRRPWLSRPTEYIPSTDPWCDLSGCRIEFRLWFLTIFTLFGISWDNLHTTYIYISIHAVRYVDIYIYIFFYRCIHTTSIYIYICVCLC